MFWDSVSKKAKTVKFAADNEYKELRCAVDPTETWLVMGGNSLRDKPRKDEKTASELRLYHLPTQTLVYKEQLEGLPLTWVAFTPSGKRIVAATADGVVRWWDVEKK